MAGIQCVPEGEHLSITKMDEDGRPSGTFTYQSDTTMDLIAVNKIDQIQAFVGIRPKRKWLISVLWLLLEWALSEFGKGR